ncbi:predicted protein [Nematostella vectensis]|uniref:Alpha-(1,6)-fucosyltransferase N- and catalytic domain-containing protein n=1 Tax=Nematostella vectensis TaxID=45351 RepID=A7S9V0_NEMVE|nr:uncharacterized protein LOC5511105 [Nematostella vectensis]EDO39487.1 predicted protein [Nematostella vectensis]|eukprot:XP_001631550.1 predicted protein [Nematostella vectensis]
MLSVSPSARGLYDRIMSSINTLCLLRMLAWLAQKKFVIGMLLLTFGIYIYHFQPQMFDYFDTSPNNADSLFLTQKSYKCDKKWNQWYKDFHAKSLASNDKNRKFLVYHCLGHKGGCGGYGNRMAGLVSTFYLAILLNRTFLIHWGGPELLDSLLEPNMIDWRYDKRKINGVPERTSYWGIERIEGYDRYQLFRLESGFHHWVQHVNFIQYFDLNVEHVETLWYYAYQLWDNPTLRKQAMDYGIPLRRNDYPYGLAGCAMNFLFKKSKALRRDFAKVKSSIKINRPMIGIHIRTSDHHFGSDNPNSYRTRDPLRVFECAKRVESALKRKNAQLKNVQFTWFLAADDKKLKDQALRLFPNKVVTLRLTPMHLDLIEKNYQQALHDLLLDKLMLLECDFLIGTTSSTFTNIALGTRQFPSKSFVYGERCELDEKAVALSPPPTD